MANKSSNKAELSDDDNWSSDGDDNNKKNNKKIISNNSKHFDDESENEDNPQPKKNVKKDEIENEEVVEMSDNEDDEDNEDNENSNKNTSKPTQEKQKITQQQQQPKSQSKPQSQSQSQSQSNKNTNVKQNENNNNNNNKNDTIPKYADRYIQDNELLFKVNKESANEEKKKVETVKILEGKVELKEFPLENSSHLKNLSLLLSNMIKAKSNNLSGQDVTLFLQDLMSPIIDDCLDIVETQEIQRWINLKLTQKQKDLKRGQKKKKNTKGVIGKKGTFENTSNKTSTTSKVFDPNEKHKDNQYDSDEFDVFT